MNIVLVGAGGYGGAYLRILYETLNIPKSLCGIVDPYAKSSPWYDRLVNDGVPFYDTLDDFYSLSDRKADLVIVSSPIQFHEEQTLTALKNGSHVLCEKPVTALVQQAVGMRDAAVWYNRLLGVGFQWSFSERMRAVKQDILDNRFGKPVLFKSYLSWPRNDDYYLTGGWKGRIKDSQGRLVYDSVVTNATSHYLHNIFFLLGESMETALMPEYMEASLFRGRDIESFDTCFLRGGFKNGARFVYCASHVSEVEEKPYIEYELEKAIISINGYNGGIDINWRDGSKEDYSHVKHQEPACKVEGMISSIENGAQPACGVDTVLPHLTVCNALFERVPIVNIPKDKLIHYDEPRRVAAAGMYEALKAYFKEETLPEGCEPVRIEFSV